MQETASAYFGSMIESYDSLIRRAVPRYDEMLSRLLDYLPARADRILELGCGTGNFSLALATRFPSAAITYVDAAPEMLDVTRRRLGALVSRTDFVQRRFEELRLDPHSFDLVTSAISLHHVEGKRALYEAIYDLIAPGGALCFSDQMRGGTESNHAINWGRWLEFCRQTGNCSEEEVRSLVDHAAAHDHYTPLGEHFRLLNEAGFQNVDCVWRDGMWAVVTAEKRI